MAKMKFDKQNNVEIPTLLLQNRNFDTYGNITNFIDLIYTENFNSANELSFRIINEDSINCDNSLTKWDDIADFRILYVPEFEERFEIKVNTEQDSQNTKIVRAMSLCESELSQITLREIEINTTNDILNPLYDENFPTVFYRNPEYFDIVDWDNIDYHGKYKDYNENKKKDLLKHSSLLHRLLEKAPHYTIGHVDKSLQNIQREFSINDSSIFDELSGEISQEFGCIFIYDSMSRTINVYDMYNTCRDCGYRGDFSDVCPECGSKNINGQLGEDTTVFITVENLANKINIETNADSLKNCFYVEGGDDLMSAAVRSCNPNGSQYIYRNSPEMKADMPKDLLQKIESYDELYEKYMSLEANEYNRYFLNHPVDDTDVTVDYNEVVKYVKTRFPNKSYLALPNPIIGFPATTSAMYDAIDLYLFLKSSMMPEIDISGNNIDKSMENIINGFSTGFKIIVDNQNTSNAFQNEIAVSNPFVSEASYIENAILKTARLFYKKAYYDLSLVRTSYTKATRDANGNLISKGCWIGKFKLESLTEKDENGNKKSITSNDIVIYVSNNSELYIEQCIYRAMGDKSDLKFKQLAGLQIGDTDFKIQLEYYSFDELSNLSSAFSTCLNLIQSILNETSMSDDWNTIDLVSKYTSFYRNRLNYIGSELEKRDSQLSYIKTVYDYENNSGILYELRLQTQKILDFETYLGDNLWKLFNSYRREDAYSNPNYISDGSSNSKLIQDAGRLLEVAKKELYKASSPQYSITSDLNNLLELEEFKPIVEHFCVGNWIRIGSNDKVYKLRILSYSVKYDDIQSINIDLSTVEKIQGGYTDLQSVIDSSKSLSSSYDSLKLQNDKSSDIINNYVTRWIEDGLNATKMKYVNADNQDLVIDENGILCRMYDYLADDYHPCQIKLVNNGLYTTSDGWNTIDSGIGRISYVDPETGKNVDTFGVIAKTVVGKLFIGESLKIYSLTSDNTVSMSFDQNGLTISNGINTVTINPNVRRLFKISNKSTDTFYTDDNGNLNITGNLNGGSININDNFTVDSNGNVNTKGNLTILGNLNIGNGGLTYNNTNGLNIVGKINSGSEITGAVINGSIINAGELNISDYFTVKGEDVLVKGEIHGQNVYYLFNGIYDVDSPFVRFYYTTEDPQFQYLSPDGEIVINITTQNEGIPYFPKGATFNDIKSQSAMIYKNMHCNGVLYENIIKGVDNIAPSSEYRKGDFIISRYWSDHTEGDMSKGRHNLLVSATKSDGSNVTGIGWSGELNTVIDNETGTAVTYYADTQLKLRGGTVTAPDVAGETITSDERLKNSFKPLNEFDDVFMDLNPFAFKYSKGKSGRYHFGFGAGHVRDCFLKHGYTTKDFGGFIQMQNDEGDEYNGLKDPMGLIYTEFVSWNTHMIQVTRKELEEVKKELAKIKQSLEDI